MGASRSTVDAGLIAVLFTDVVQSTELWVQLGEVRADEMRRRLRSASDRVVATSHGTVVKDLGDGVMATFPTASACIDAAVELQRVTMQLGRASGVPELRIRVGASIGEATRDDDDWFGTPVIEAARLCALAEPGQILVHETIAVLARRAEHEARPVGVRALKGLPEPVPVREIAWATAPSATSPLPPMLRPPADAMPFVGRSTALGLLQRARTKMATDHLVLVSGEPGVGKTRLVSEFAADWTTAGDAVVGTWFSESGESFTRSITRLLRQLADITAPPSWSGPLLDRITGAARGTDQEIDPASIGDAVAGWITAIAVDRPTLIVLDDLHWAPPAALTMLEALLEGLDDAPALVVGTYRDTDLDRKHPLADWLATRRRTARPDRIDLHGLDLDDVAGLVIGTSQNADPQTQALCSELYHETEGNAFFVGQMIEHLRETGVLAGEPGRMHLVPGTERLGLPQGVRELVGRRLHLLPEGSDDVLAVAAVQGRAFSVAVTTTAMPGGPDRVVEVLDAATRAGLIEPMAGSLDRFQFVHALVRETVLDEIATLRRCRLHLDVARALDALAPQAAGVAALEIAQHYLEGAALGGLPRAVDLIERNAPRSTDFLMDQLGAVHAALAAADEVGLDDVRLIQLHRYLGRWRWMVDGDRQAGRESFRTAVALARATGDHQLLAETISFAPPNPFGIDPEFAALAAEVLPLIEPTSRAGLNLRMKTLFFDALVAPPGVDPAAEYLAVCRDAAAHDLPVIRDLAHLCLHACPDLETVRANPGIDVYVCWGWARVDLQEGQAVLDSLERTQRRASPIQRAGFFQAQSMLALARGEIDEAERLTDIVEELAAAEPMYALGIPTQRAAQARWRGDLVREEQLVRPLLPFLPYPRLVHLAEAQFLMREGDRDRAVQQFEEAWADGPHSLGRDWAFTFTLGSLAQLAADLGLPERCSPLDALLRPFDGQFMMSTCVELTSSASFLRGQLAHTQGRTDEAIAHLERALAFESSNGAVLMAERTRGLLERVRNGA